MEEEQRVGGEAMAAMAATAVGSGSGKETRTQMQKKEETGSEIQVVANESGDCGAENVQSGDGDGADVGGGSGSGSGSETRNESGSGSGSGGESGSDGGACGATCVAWGPSGGQVRGSAGPDRREGVSGACVACATRSRRALREEWAVRGIQSS